MRTTNPIEERIVALIEPAAEELGYRLVRVRLSGLRRKRLQIMAERICDGAMVVSDCTKLSRLVSNLLDVEDPITDEYDLEVSSPGIDRPLMRIEDFARFIGHEAKMESAAMVDGRKRYKGVIAGVDGDKVRLKLPDAELEVVLAFASLSDARLVLTDRLIEEDLKRSKQAERGILPPVAGEVSPQAAKGAPDASPLDHHASRADRSPAGGANKKRKNQ